MDNYKGTNSKTEFAKVRIKSNICNILYVFLLLSILITIMILILNKIIDGYKVDSNTTTDKAILIVIDIILLFINGGLIGLIIILIIHSLIHFKTLKYYKNVELIDVHLQMIPYDYKLWLTAPKDTYHAISIDYNGNHYKTAIIFTNSDKYYGFPKFKMPEVLMAKNYIKNYGLVGYDKNKDEIIIINFKKNPENY